MKVFTCDRCRPFGATEPCVLCGDDIKPTHCPCTDSMKPYATWKECDAHHVLSKQNQKIMPDSDINLSPSPLHQNETL
jgi:hypothetical protein